MAEKKVKDLLNLDLYQILDVPPDATEKQIVKAYRKKALKCHPDKNPDNPKAAEQFHELSNALEVLTDTAAKAAYDKVLRARKASELRNRELDAKRKKLKNDLEARELSSFQRQTQESTAAKNLEQQIARLRKEGSRLLREERARLEEEVRRNPRPEPKAEEDSTVAPRLKVRWKPRRDDPENGTYTMEDLTKIFSTYGVVSALIVSSKKKGSAIVEFESAHSALRAVQLETGRSSNPITLSWLSGQPSDGATSTPFSAEGATWTAAPLFTSFPTGGATHTAAPLFASFPSEKRFDPPPAPPPDSDNRDFESVVLMRMRQAQERKRLIAQMQQEDDEADDTSAGKRTGETSST